MTIPAPDVARFFTNTDRSVYALQNLPEEVVAYLFARYSRSRLSLRDDLRNMIEAEGLGALIGTGTTDTPGQDIGRLQERARAFAEKYVLGYGHSSVAEHGVVHLALEDVSIVASKLIEDARLASYTEKSTRYVAFDAGKMHTPEALTDHPALLAEYQETIAALLDAYTGWTEDFVRQIKAGTPKTDKQTERGYDAASRATAFDLLRALLPAATHTNIGLTLNARALQHLITKLLSQPLAEGQVLGERIKEEAQHVVPTLLKYADPNAYRADTADAIDTLAREVLGADTGTGSAGLLVNGESRSATQEKTAGMMPDALLSVGDTFPLANRPALPVPVAPDLASASSVSLVFADPDADIRLVAAILYGPSGLPMEALLERVRAMDADTQARVVDEYLSRRGRHDAPGRALERLFCTVEMTMDYGAYRDVQRHRMATQTVQPLSPALGFARAAEWEAFGYADRFDALMARAARTFTQMQAAGLTREAAYVLPLATRVRALFTWNLREVTHFVELRSARQGHPSYRKVAQDVYHAVAAEYPLIARYLRPNLNTYALTRD